MGDAADATSKCKGIRLALSEDLGPNEIGDSYRNRPLEPQRVLRNVPGALQSDSAKGRCLTETDRDVRRVAVIKVHRHDWCGTWRQKGDVPRLLTLVESSGVAVALAWLLLFG